MWVRRNFAPRNSRVKSAQHYTEVLKVKHMIQKRLFRKSHPDEHYRSALFCSQREFSVQYRQYSAFIRQTQAGEPGYPVAVTSRVAARLLFPKVMYLL